MCREYLWCDIFGLVWKCLRFGLEYFMGWGGYVLMCLCSFVILYINVGGEREVIVLIL